MLLLSLAVRELRRRSVRSALTASGIAIGVAALILLGAFAEKLTRLVAGGRDFASGQITVSGAGTGAVSSMTRGALLAGDQLQALRGVAGVAAVEPLLVFPVDETPALVPFTLPALVFGVDVDALLFNGDRSRTPPPRVRTGKLTPAPGTNEVVVGSQVARRFELDVGSTLTVRKRTFQVVGVLEPTLTGPDSFVFMSFQTAQRLLIDTEPVLRRIVTSPGGSAMPLPVATAAAVFWEPDGDPEALATRIRSAAPELSVVSPRDATTNVDRALTVIDSLILGSALVALLVASLAVTNTMFTAVTERRNEIGLRRVVGATRRQVIGQLVCEAVLLGFVGSALGVVAGVLGVHALNTVTERIGSPAFLMTVRLLLAGATVPAVLAACAGLWPAWRAARLTPTDAMRFS